MVRLQTTWHGEALISRAIRRPANSLIAALVVVACAQSSNRTPPTAPLSTPPGATASASRSLTQALLTQADVPNNMAPTDTHPPALEKSPNVICGSPIPTGDTLAEAAVGFGQPSESGDLLFERVIQYVTGRAAQTMDAVRATMSQCLQWTETGAPNPYIVTHLQVPTVGDDRVGFTVSFDTSEKWVEDVVALQVGDRIAWITFGSLDDSPLADILQRAVARLH